MEWIILSVAGLISMNNQEWTDRAIVRLAGTRVICGCRFQDSEAARSQCSHCITRMKSTWLWARLLMPNLRSCCIFEHISKRLTFNHEPEKTLCWEKHPRLHMKGHNRLPVPNPFTEQQRMVDVSSRNYTECLLMGLMPSSKYLLG